MEPTLLLDKLRLLKAYHLISPAYVVIEAANAFKGKTTAIN